MSQQLRLLFVTETAFYPPFQGDSARMGAMIDFFRTAGEHVAVVHLHDAMQRDADYEEMAERCARLEIYRPRGEELARRSEGGMDAWCPDGLVELATRVAREEAVDAIVVEFVFLSRILSSPALAGNVVRVLDADNVFENRATQYASCGLPYDWFSARAGEERSGLLRADLILAIQEREREKISALVPERRVLLVPHSLPACEYKIPVNDELLFVGAGNVENTLGMQKFFAEVWPRARSAHPNARLRVAGRVCDRLGGAPAGVELLGLVDDLTPIYETALIALNPAPIGTGLKIKTVEALHRGRCLISTPMGVQGLEDFAGIYLVARSSPELAEILIGALADVERTRRIGYQAWNFSSTYFRRDYVLGILDEELRQLIRLRSPARPEFVDAAAPR